MSFNAVVTTTINKPSKGLKKIISSNDWRLYVVGDLKTPHSYYSENKNIIYLHPDVQHKKYPKLSESIGWNSIQRRNIGFVEAYKDGAEIIATIDDDNIPLDNWGNNLNINKEIEVNCYENEFLFDPFSQTNISKYWHRGYPPELLNSRKKNLKSKKTIKPIIEVGLWNGYPDADAISKIIYGYKKKKIKGDFPFASKKTIFSSQNAFLHRTAFPNYAVLPHVGRMDDIWGCILFQKITKQEILFTEPSTIHDRNIHNLISDLKEEIIGYDFTNHFLNNDESCLPDKTKIFLEEYRKILC